MSRPLAAEHSQIHQGRVVYFLGDFGELRCSRVLYFTKSSTFGLSTLSRHGQVTLVLARL